MTPEPLKWDTPGLRFDSGLKWDGFAPEPDTNPHKKPMAQIKMNLSKKSREAVAALGLQVHNALDGNANFTALNPALATALADITALQTGITELEALRQEAKLKTAAVEALSETVKDHLTAWAKLVENQSGGDPEIILSGGFDLRDEGSPSVMLKVTGLEVTAGDDDGEADLMWDPQEGASSYEIQCSPDPNVPAGWIHAGISTKSSKTLANQTSGARCWFRVRAVGPNGEGPWSDPAVVTVP
ncbi:MAG: fibronectin type III domain-containing protein [Verrucomicrobiae bacterium]|nr:fibronectin type III domain-containing protein [Verrucomicrobiae bacterium]